MVALMSDPTGILMLIGFQNIRNHKLMEFPRPTSCTS